MKSFDKKKHILKLISTNPKGVSIDTIIDYLDYINKVLYSKDEIEKILLDLIIENKIFCKNKIYYLETSDGEKMS